MSRRGKQPRQKPPGYDPSAQARRMARALLGTPPGQRVVPSKKKKKKPKHKKRAREREMEG